MKEHQDIAYPRSFVSFDQAVAFFGEEWAEYIEECELCGWFSLNESDHPQGTISDPGVAGDSIGCNHICHDCCDEVWHNYELGNVRSA